MNRFVSAREGHDAPARRPSQMGRLGRACLYASFIFVTSVGGTLAASRGALPGDLLYPVKLQVESIRMRTLPAHMRDELAAYALAERINELGRLVEAGEISRAAGLAPAIQDGYAKLAALGVADALPDDALVTRLEVLDGLLDVLPAEAHEAIERAMDQAPAPRTRGLGPQTDARGVPHGAAVPSDAHTRPHRGAEVQPSAEPRRGHGRPAPDREVAPAD